MSTTNNNSSVIVKSLPHGRFLNANLAQMNTNTINLQQQAISGGSTTTVAGAAAVNRSKINKSISLSNTMPMGQSFNYCSTNNSAGSCLPSMLKTSASLNIGNNKKLSNDYQQASKNLHSDQQDSFLASYFTTLIYTKIQNDFFKLVTNNCRIEHSFLFNDFNSTSK